MRTRKWLHVVAAATISLSVTSCAGETPAPEPAVTVSGGSSRATVDEGDTVVVNLGEWSSGVGDAWVLTEEPDPAVLVETQPTREPGGGDESVGGRTEMTDTYKAVGAGVVTLTYEYRFRGEVPEDPAQQYPPQRFEITVR